MYISVRGQDDINVNFPQFSLIWQNKKYIIYYFFIDFCYNQNKYQYQVMHHIIMLIKGTTFDAL